MADHSASSEQSVRRVRYVVMALESGAPIGDALIIGPHRSYVTAREVANRFNNRHPDWSATVVHLYDERAARIEASGIDEQAQASSTSEESAHG